MKVSEDVGLLIRSAGERLSFEQHGKLLNPVLGISAGDQVCCVISYAIDVVSIVLTLTAIRALHSPHHDHDHDPARDVFQSMGILAQVEQWELLGVLSDTVWRGLLMGCANAGGGVLMRQASGVIYQCLLSLKSCPADSLTYGLYVRALSSKERKPKHRSVDRTASDPTSDPSGMNSSRRPLCLDYSLHLEDTGMEWFYQRLQASHGRGNPSTELHADLESAAHASRGAPKRLSIRSNSSPPPPSRSLLLTRRAEVKPEQVLKQSITKFGLTSPEGGVLSFKRPASSVGLYPAMVVQESGCDAELYPEAQHVASDIDALLDQLHRDAARPVPTSSSSSADTSIKVDPIEELLLPSPPPPVESASTGDESADSPQQQPQPVPAGAQQSSFASLKQRFFGGSSSKSSNARKGPEPLSAAAAASGSTSSSSSSSSSSWTSKVSQAFFKKSVQAPDSCDEKTAAVIAQPGAHKKPRISVIKLAAATQSFEDEDVEEENEEVSDDDGSAIDPTDDDDGGGVVVHSSSSSSSTGEASATSELDGSKAAPDISEHQLSADIDAAVAEETAAEISKSAIEPLKDEHASAADDESSDDDADALIASASAATITSGDLNTILSPEDDSIRSPELSSVVDSAVGHNEREAADCNVDMVGTADGATSSSTETTTTVSFSAVTSNAEESVLAEEPPPAAVSPPLIDVVTVHEKLLDLFSGIAQRRGSVVGISCCTPCPHCRYSMTEEDILSGWCAGSGYDDHVKGNPRSRLARNMTAIHQVTCRQCSEHFSPRLTIGVYSSCEGAGGAVQCSQLETVPFMSPFGVRFELEQLLSTEGDKVVIFADQLRDRHPAVYWGVQWYSARLNMPCSMLAPVSSPEMMSGPPVCELPVVIGWRECVVRANASKVLSGLDSEPLRIADVFPECSAEDVQYLKTEVASRLDGSAHNMRFAMLRYSECASIVHRWGADGFSSARTIHIGLLSLCYIENRRDMISIPKTSSKLLRSNNMHSLAILSKVNVASSIYPPSNTTAAINSALLC